MKIKKHSFNLVHCGEPMWIGVIEYTDGDKATHAFCGACHTLSLIHCGTWEDDSEWPIEESRPNEVITK